MKDTHPFYCHKKKCQKSAWNTPEYLNQSNWDDIKKVIGWIKDNDFYSFWLFVHEGDRAKNFFYKCIAWPEGYVYCQSESYCEKAGFPMICKHLEELQKAIDNRAKKI